MGQASDEIKGHISSTREDLLPTLRSSSAGSSQQWIGVRGFGATRR